MKIADTNSYMTTTGSVADPINDYLNQDSIAGAQGARATCGVFDWKDYFNQHVKPYDSELAAANKLNINKVLDLCERAGSHSNEWGKLGEENMMRLHHLSDTSQHIAILRKEWIYCRRNSLVCHVCKHELKNRHRQFWKTLPNGFVLC